MLVYCASSMGVVVGLQCVIVAFSGHAHLLFLCSTKVIFLLEIMHICKEWSASFIA